MIVRNYRDEIKETTEQLKLKERKEKQGKVRDRLKFLRLLKENRARTVREASDLVGICAQTGYRIMSRYRDGGLPAVIKLNYRGKPSKIGPDGEKLFASRAQQGFYTLKEAKHWLKEELGEDYTEPAVWFMLKRLRVKLRRGRAARR